MKNLGFIGYPNYAITTDGKIFSNHSGRFLKTWENEGGYICCILCNDGVPSNFYVHRLVAMSYIPNDDLSKTQVNHKNGVKTDNTLINLEWCTPSENSTHANTTGIRKKPFKDSQTPDVINVVHNWQKDGKRNGDWTEQEARQAAMLLEQGYRVCDVSSMTGLDRRGIQFLRDGERQWGFLALEYDFEKVKRKERTSPETVVRICEALQEGLSINEVAKLTGVGRKIVSGIYNRKTHTRLTEEYIW